MEKDFDKSSIEKDLEKQSIEKGIETPGDFAGAAAVKSDIVDKVNIKAEFEPKHFKGEVKEYKVEFKEKREKLEVKEKSEVKEFKEFKEVREKDFAEVPAVPDRPGPGPGPGGVEQRLANLENTVTQLGHFIQSWQRPDLGDGALGDEPDLAAQSANLKQQSEAAKSAKDNKDVEKLIEAPTQRPTAEPSGSGGSEAEGGGSEGSEKEH